MAFDPKKWTLKTNEAFAAAIEQARVLNNPELTPDHLLAALGRDRELDLGINEPYGPGDGVYHTIGRHGEGRGLPCAMLEVRNDQIADAEGQARWAARLAADFRQALVGLHSERRWGSTDH